MREIVDNWYERWRWDSGDRGTFSSSLTFELQIQVSKSTRHAEEMRENIKFAMADETSIILNVLVHMASGNDETPLIGSACVTRKAIDIISTQIQLNLSRAMINISYNHPTGDFKLIKSECKSCAKQHFARSSFCWIKLIRMHINQTFSCRQCYFRSNANHVVLMGFNKCMFSDLVHMSSMMMMLKCFNLKMLKRIDWRILEKKKCCAA